MYRFAKTPKPNIQQHKWKFNVKLHMKKYEGFKQPGEGIYKESVSTEDHLLVIKTGQEVFTVSQ